MRDLPKRMKIGGLSYRVKRLAVDKMAAGEMAYVFRPKQEIVIRDDLQGGYAWLVLLHEVIHEMNCDNSERETEYQAAAWFQFLKDNGFLE